jgi:hypothetical protein
LFKRGTLCSGALTSKGSGTKASPINISAYAPGTRPIIEADAKSEAALHLMDQQGWDISNIKTVGGNPYGILISGTKGTLSHFRLKSV